MLILYLASRALSVGTRLEALDDSLELSLELSRLSEHVRKTRLTHLTLEIIILSNPRQLDLVSRVTQLIIIVLVFLEVVAGAPR